MVVAVVVPALVVMVPVMPALMVMAVMPALMMMVAVVPPVVMMAMMPAMAAMMPPIADVRHRRHLVRGGIDDRSVDRRRHRSRRRQQGKARQRHQRDEQLTHTLLLLGSTPTLTP